MAIAYMAPTLKYCYDAAMTKSDTITTNVRIPSELWQRLKSQVGASHMSQNAFILALLESGLDAAEASVAGEKSEFFGLAARYIAERTSDDELRRDARKFAGGEGIQ